MENTMQNQNQNQNQIQNQDQNQNNLKPRQAQQAQRIARLTPAVDILENADEFLLIAEVPGVKSDAVELRFSNDTLTLQARRQPNAETEDNLVVEYNRSFLLPKGIDATKIQAEQKDGLLRVHLPKAETHKPRTIQVNAR